MENDRGKSSRAIGDLGRLDDRVLVSLFEFLDPASLCAMSATCFTAYCFCTIDALWKPIAMSQNHAKLDFSGAERWKDAVVVGSRRLLVTEKVLFSDVLYRQFRLRDVAIPETDDDLERIRDAENAARFVDEFESIKKPCVLLPCQQQHSSLNLDNVLVDVDQGAKLRVGGLTLSPAQFRDYLRCLSRFDECPLYWFDCANANVGKLDAVTAPGVFVNRDESRWLRDLFVRVLPEKYVPDRRWVVAGNRRSGSKWHIDPNFTHAWNWCLSGRKKWLFSKATPDGVSVLNAGLNVLQPETLAEWYESFYDSKKYVECTQSPGEVVYVPSGWWHCVFNLSDNCLAITQNYVPEREAASTFAKLSAAPHLISGMERSKRLAFVESLRNALTERGLLSSSSCAKRLKPSAEAFSFDFAARFTRC